MEADPMGTAVRPEDASATETSAGNAVILMYHRIADDGTDLCVPPAEFRAHMAWLRETGCRVLPLAELADSLASGETTEKRVAITLDDGYLDAMTHAVPILREFDLPATFFIVSSTLEETSEFWWEALERVFAHDRLPASLDVALPEGSEAMPTRTDEQKRAAFDAVRRTFYTLPLERQRERVEHLLRWAGLPPVDASRPIRPMTPEELLELDRVPGMEIGAHTEHHLLLPAQSASIKQREIADGKRRLEALLGHEVRSLSYPHGAFDEETVEMTGRAGFSVAVTTGNQPAWRGSHPLVLPRCAVQAGDDFGARLQALFATPPQRHHYDRTFA
jgi:peptidoglycan/xylan/chitin deacetylase (PgdA/CDA1 family)